MFALLLVFASSLAAQQNRFGSPACSGPDRELADRTFFLLCHSGSLKVPVWVSYELKPEYLMGNAARPKRFRRDASLSQSGAQDSDYKGSGFVRGHMAPAEDFSWSEEAIRSTFLLSNAVPQRHNPNAGRWSQLEAAVRRLAAVSDAVYVVTGPIFDSAQPEFIGPGRVAVPSHTFKAVLAVRGLKKSMYAAIIPNDAVVKGPLHSFGVTVAEVQRRTGLDFFDALEDEEERRLESSPSRSGDLHRFQNRTRLKGEVDARHPAGSAAILDSLSNLLMGGLVSPTVHTLP